MTTTKRQISVYFPHDGKLLAELKYIIFLNNRTRDHGGLVLSQNDIVLIAISRELNRLRKALARRKKKHPERFLPTLIEEADND